MGCAVLGGRSWWWWPQPQNARGRAQAIAIPPLCHPPPPCFTYPAIAALAAPRGIPGEGSEGKRAKRRMGARPALQMGLRPPPTRISIG